MTVRFRTDGPWGAGLGVDFPAEWIDENFWTLLERIIVLEGLPGAAAGIDYFIIQGDQLTVVMEDYSTRGPYTLPVFNPQGRGQWTPDTSYLRGDMFSINSTVYVVRVAHTSAATFDPNATNGEGQDLYGEFFQVLGVLPAGGAGGMWLRKNSSTDYDVSWALSPVPTGGTTGQVLVKDSNDDFDTAWITQIFSISDASDAESGDPVNGEILRWDSASEEFKKQQDYPINITSAATITLGLPHVYRYNRCTNVTETVITVPPEADWTEGVLQEGMMFHFRASLTAGPMYFVEGDDSIVTIEGMEGYLNQTSIGGAVATLVYVGNDTWELYGTLAEGVVDEYAT